MDYYSLPTNTYPIMGQSSSASKPMPLPCRLFAITLMIALMIGASFPAAAADGSVDITVAGTFQFGGAFELVDPEFGFIDLQVEDSGGTAVFLGVPVNRLLQVEFIAISQDTEVAIDEGPFNGDFVIGDLELDYYHAGIVWHFPLGQIEPYFALSGGVSRFNFKIDGVRDETFPSASIGGGLKARFTDHFGLRLDARLFFTDFDDDLYDRNDRCRRSCDEGAAMTQGFIAGGVLFSF